MSNRALPEEMQRILQQLLPLHRAVLTLRYASQLSYEKIATEMNLSVDSVKQHMHNALVEALTLERRGLFAENGIPFPTAGEEPIAAEGSAPSDQDRLNWIESNTTLHRSVEVLYVVDGYEVKVTDSTFGRASEREYRGSTFREAIDAAMCETPVEQK